MEYNYKGVTMSLLKKYKKDSKKTNKEKALEKDYQKWCEITGGLPNKELNRRYNKNYLLR